MVIKVLDIVSACNTAAEGEQLAKAARAALATNDEVRLSFSGVADVPSSFINASIVSLFRELSAVNALRKLIIADVNPQISGMIRRCVENSRRADHAA